MGKNSRDRLKAKRKAAEAARRRRGGSGSAAGGFDPGVFGTAGGFDPGVSGTADIPTQRRSTDVLIDQAVRALHYRMAGDFALARDRLVAGPGGAAGVQVVNRALFAALTEEVEHAWQNGWLPAELIRAARRQYAPPHSRLVADACAATMRNYPAATVSPIWKSQLADAAAHVWWTHDDRFVNEAAERTGTDRPSVITAVLEVLHLLRTMPPVAVTAPLPGTAEAAPATAELDQRLLDRVRALLAKAESTDFPEEAEAYTAKAQELMARHRIDHALLAASAGPGRDRPAARRIPVDNPYEQAKSLLVQVVAEANSCRAIWMKHFGLVALVGYATDLDATEMLFTSLLVQATRAMTGAGSQKDRHGRNTTRSFRQSFLSSYASRIGERLSATSEQVGREATATESGAALLPVLAARSDAVNDAFAEQFPHMTQVTATINNREGWASGRAAADRAVLHGHEQLPH